MAQRKNKQHFTGMSGNESPRESDSPKLKVKQKQAKESEETVKKALAF